MMTTSCIRFGVVLAGALGGCSSPAGSHDGATDAAMCIDAAQLAKDDGVSCICGGECRSGFCIDGVCCNQACSGDCSSCVVPGKMGTCSPLPAGAAPSSPLACARQAPESCGHDGTCDGAGACRRYPAGTVCVAGKCSGDAVTGISVCDGVGACRAGPDVVCVPYACDATAGACFEECSSRAECAGARQCADGSCGAKLNGSACLKAVECASGSCVDGVCCATACDAPCMSCNQPGTVGRCLPVPDGTADVRNLCNAGSGLCADTGLCQAGLCVKPAAGTVCAAATCSGNVLSQTATCNGSGQCQTPITRDCTPFRCITSGGAAACVETCSSDADCVIPATCDAGSCGLKKNGGACTSDVQCQSGICADGVCCNARCTGLCRSCALTGSVGTCTLATAGAADPRGTCLDQGSKTCGTNGRCDGAGACQKYAVGTICAGELCSNGSYTPVSSCDASGRCIKPASLSCGPYVCNGARCYESCADSSACLAPNQCVNGSCGLKSNGASCSSAAECSSGVCAQGVCCAQSCSGACKSCALPAYLGSCRTVADGLPDPAGVCRDQGAASCDQTGLCAGGVCARYPSGTQCAAPTCSGTTASSARLCDGNGSCKSATQSLCWPYACDATTCKLGCSTSGDCATPASCLGGSCSLKPNAMSCAASNECVSARCVDGVCCDTACTGACRSCVLADHVGSCTMVASGTPDPRAVCSVTAASTCGTDGTCDGQGVCHKYSAGTQCVAASCTGTTAASARLCDGAGACKQATQSSCLPYVCGASACKTECTAGTDCAAPATCIGGVCQLRPNGLTCGSNSECVSAHCVDGVCCDTTCTGGCRSCNLAGSTGTCTLVSAGQTDPRGACSVTAASTCGNNGTCDGLGGCAKYPSGTQCVAPTCSGTTATSARLCDGAGTCKPATQSSCAPFVCGPSACKTSCASDSECVAPRLCLGGICTLKSNGTSCAAATECLSGKCVDGVCCDALCAGVCRSCNLSGHEGACTLAASAQPDPRGGCTASAAATCGNDGTCDGQGACHLHAAGTQCAGASCSGSVLAAASVCDGSGICVAGAQSSCAPYLCGTLACKESCAANSDCVVGTVCAGDRCVAPLPLGQTCSRSDQCSSGYCTDGYCCGTAACPSPACSASTLTMYRCGALGSCAAQTTSCDAYACNAAGNACLTSCSSDLECSVGNVCRSGACGPALDGGTLDGSASD